MMNYEYRDVIDYWNTRGTAIRIYMDDIAIATSTKPGRPHQSSISSIRSCRTTGSLFQTGEMYLPCPTNGLPGGNP
jgi:hypothetical protein